MTLADLTKAELQPFRADLAPTIVGWARTDAERDAWASLRGGVEPEELFTLWHADPDVRPFVLGVGGEPCAYGEIWREGDEVELARVIVAPDQRSRGVGRTLMRLLAESARSAACRAVYVRVVPTNAAALMCYRAAGFARVTQAEERAFNADQPRAYVWMRAAGERALTASRA